MTTKTLTGTYNAGYALSASFGVLSIAGSGLIGGFGLTTSAAAVVYNAGRVASAAGANGSLSNGNGNVGNDGVQLGGHGSLVNSGAVAAGRGGDGYAGAASFTGYGGAGGVGVVLAFDDVMTNSGGAITGGAGGDGAQGAGNFRGYGGGAGGDGVYSIYGIITNTAGTIAGGAGGAGAGGSAGGPGGVGGVGVSAHTLALVNHGSVLGGAGGASGGGSAHGGAGVAGGAGVSLNVGFIQNFGAVIGGAGSVAGATEYNQEDGSSPFGQTGGAGGAAVYMSGAGRLYNGGMLAGSQGGKGGYDYFGGRGGAGGAGALLEAGGIVGNGAGGTILGGAGGTGGSGGSFQGGGGSGGVGGAGGAGVVLVAGGSIGNRGTILGGAGGAGGPGAPGYPAGASGAAGVGVILTAGGTLANYDLVSGVVGVEAGGMGQVQVIDYGTIQGTGGTAVSFSSSSDVLELANGAVILGKVQGGGGLLVINAQSGTVTGLGGGGVVAGEASATFAGFQFYGFGVESRVTLTGAVDITADQAVELYSGATLSVAGVIDNAGILEVGGSSGRTSLRLTAATTLTGGGWLSLGKNVNNLIVGVSAGTVLTNEETIQGGGDIGGGKLVLVNGAGALIDANQTRAMTIDTGSRKITNAGVIESANTGGLVIASAIANAGTLAALAGTLIVNGAVTGGGAAVIGKATLVLNSSFSEAVSFTGKGVLQLAQSQGYGGTVTGFSAGGGTVLDLRDIGFVSAAEATFTGNNKGGTLTVTDGIHTSQIQLAGSYRKAQFVAADDGNGGTFITAEPRPGAAPLAIATVHRFAAAAASLASHTAEPTHQNGTWREPAILAKPA